MEPVTIILIVYSILATVLHGYRIKKSKCRAGKASSCFKIEAELERKNTTVVQTPSQPVTVDIPNLLATK